MTYRQALAALEARQETRIELGLDRVRERAARLGHPERRLRCFHVAGTNGKGSTCAILEAALRAAGHKTGFYSSPHLSDVRERIKINGRPVAKAVFADAISRVLKADPEKRLTYFELLTLAAFLIFASEACDAVVLETGLGGRLDATNIVEKPAASIITSISFDHMALLGNTLAAIAGEKAGIAKKGVPLICSELPAPAMRVVRAAAKKAGARLTVVRRGWTPGGVDWKRRLQRLRRTDGKSFDLSLLGDKQGVNAALAWEALRAGLPISDAALARGLKRVAWPGRFDVRRLGPKTAILDGAHNPEAASSLARTWRSSPWAKRQARWIVGVLRDKDARAVLHELAPALGEVVAVEPPSPRALSAAELAKLIRAGAPRARVTVEPDAETALRRWKRESAAPKTAVVCGSFYLVGQAARILGGNAR